MAQPNDKPTDLSTIHSRARLLEEGLKHYNAGSLDKAIDCFGAAIRKARREKYWDVEIEYYRFATLFRMGDYNGAIQRCVLCLDGLHETRMRHIDAKLPFDVIQDHLEKTLLGCMVRRGDSLLTIQAHLNKRSGGEFYLSKRPLGWLEAVQAAWQASSAPVTPSPESIRNELRVLSTVMLKSVVDSLIESDAAALNHLEEGDAAGKVDTVASAGGRAAAASNPEVVPGWVMDLLGRPLGELSVAQEKRLCAYLMDANITEHLEPLAQACEFATDSVRNIFLEALSKNLNLPSLAKKDSAARKLSIMIQGAIKAGGWN